MSLQVNILRNQILSFSFLLKIGHAIGRQAMLGCNVIPRLAELFNDKEASVRRNAHKAVSMYSEAPPGIEFCVIKTQDKICDVF
jgi:hypothetical protein